MDGMLEMIWKDYLTYTFERAAKNDMTVADWKEIRFKSTYAGFDVAVVNGGDVHGGTKLGNVRDSYD